MRNRKLQALVLHLSLGLASGGCEASPTSGGSGGSTGGNASGGSSNGNANSTDGSNGSGSNGVTDGSAGSDNGRTGTGGTTGRNDGGAPPDCEGLGAPAVAKLKLELVVEGLERLVYAAQPMGSSAWYLVEQTGKIRVAVAGTLRSAPFLDLSAEVSHVHANGDERGLLGLAFPPDYAKTGKFYVMLTSTDPNRSLSGPDQVREYTRSRADPYVASTTARSIVTIEGRAFNHNGGTVLFGPDGLLYVGTGDDGGGCNLHTEGAAQKVDSLFGKILRLDLTQPAPYAAASNPFAADGDPRVLHYGLRNPFRFGFDRANGDLYVADVGEKAFEEVSLAPAGASGLNFGWAKFEGHATTCEAAGWDLRPRTSHTPPFFVADRLGGTTPKFEDYKSVIGGFVYRGQARPDLRGTYVFGDYAGAYMGAVTRCATGVSAVTAIRKQCLVGERAACLDSGSQMRLSILTGIVEGSDGEMYLVANSDRLYRVVP